VVWAHQDTVAQEQADTAAILALVDTADIHLPLVTQAFPAILVLVATQVSLGLADIPVEADTRVFLDTAVILVLVDTAVILVLVDTAVIQAQAAIQEQADLVDQGVDSRDIAASLALVVTLAQVDIQVRQAQLVQAVTQARLVQQAQAVTAALLERRVIVARPVQAVTAARPVQAVTAARPVQAVTAARPVQAVTLAAAGTQA